MMMPVCLYLRLDTVCADDADASHGHCVYLFCAHVIGQPNLCHALDT